MRSSATIARRGGYTMVELLVVVAIMIALATLLLLVLGGKPAEVKRTEAIIATVRMALGLAGAQRGAMSPTEHPFAGSQADAGGQRFAFVRGGDPTWSGPVATTGTALTGVPNPGYLDADTDHLLMGSDRFADRRIPLLFGAMRGDLRVLQSQRKLVTKFRALPMPVTGGNGPAKVVSPRTGQRTPGGYQGDVNADYPDTLVPSRAQLDDPGYGRLSDTKPALDYLFGASSAQSDLAALKALHYADPTLPVEVNDFRVPVEPRTLGAVSEGLVYTDHGSGRGNDGTKAENRWRPGRIPVSGTASKRLDAQSGTWVRYRLAGLAVYDAWGNELFTVASANDAFRVISAGPDGVLAVAPGTDDALDTDLVGDLRERLPIDERDLDGAKDNLQ